MKKIISIVVMITVVLATFAGLGISRAYALSGAVVTVTPNTTGAQDVDFKITLQMGPNGLNRYKNIYIQFPDNYPLPSSINPADVKIGGNPAYNVTVNETLVTLQLGDYAFAPNQPDIVVEFLSGAGLSNPTTPSTYTLTLWTDDEPEQLTTSYVITVTGANGTSVSGLSVYMSPADAGKPADYTLVFNVSQDGALVASNGDYVDVYFPAGTGMPENYDPTNVLMKTFPCSKVVVSGTRVRVYVPSDLGIIPPGAQCNIEFLKSFGIKNPELPGKYALMVTTSQDTGLATSNLYQIIGTPVSNASVTVDPSSQLSVADYKVVFRTSDTGSLTKGEDKINIVFPKTTKMPANIVPGAITVNGTPCTSVSVSVNKLTIIVPVNISADTDVTVDISKNFGIENPSSTGKYKLEIYTSSDASPVDVDFEITMSNISKVSVQLSTTSAGAVCQYTVSFNTGASGALSAGTDKINIMFPVGTTIPETVPTSSITVNNIPTTSVKISGTTLTITVPVSIPANSSVTVVISEKAGIKNPVTSGSYKIYVSTSKETAVVPSDPYKIYIVPQAKITVVPPEPNGENGFYITQPVVNFSASSPVDPSPYIYYYFDTNQPVLYTGQAITVPEGIHILHYYAVDHQNHIEQPQSKEFKVDTVPPQLVVSYPKDDAVLSSKKITVQGTVDPGSTVKVDGVSASVDKTGHFSADVEITGNNSVIVVIAQDPAGNTTRKTISVSIDTTPPKLDIISPVPFQEIHRLPLLVRGTTEKGAIVTVNGNPAVVDENGNFTYQLENLSENGISMITIIAKDKAGNVTKKVINVKYVKTTIIKLQIGNKVALINSATKMLDTPPVIIKNRTFVPLRFVSEAFGAILSWDPVFKIIDIQLGGQKIRLQVGKNFASVNGKKVMMNVAPLIVKNRTMVPIRFVSEALDAQVLWDPATKTITIVYPKPNP